ncbi:MAG: LysR family transcriptional regulator [Xanthomonadales bacterium]|nr:LysR family transcriptional regulator [Xanthomonadales bacterium]
MNKFADMKAFIRIVDAGSITKAADQLHVAKSAVSKRLSDLEHRLGVTLLNRTTRSQALTDDGKIYYQQCVRIIDDISEVESSLQSKLCALTGTIKITVPLSFGLSHLAPVLHKFNLMHKQIKFDIDFSDRKVDIVNEGYDMSIRIGKLEDSSLKAKKITSVKTLLVASQDYLDRRGTPNTVKDLLSKHVKLHYRNTTGTVFFKNENQVSIPAHIPNVMTSNNGEYLCQAAINGMGLLNTPDFLCYKHIKSGALVRVLPDCYQPTIIGVYAIYPQTKHLPRRIRELIDFIVQSFGNKPYWNLD